MLNVLILTDRGLIHMLAMQYMLMCSGGLEPERLLSCTHLLDATYMNMNTLQIYYLSRQMTGTAKQSSVSSVLQETGVVIYHITNNLI